MTPIVVREGNTIKIPPELGKRLGITPGRQVYVYQLGDTLSVRLKPSQLLEACEEFEAAMLKEEVTLDDLRAELAKEAAEQGKAAEEGS